MPTNHQDDPRVKLMQKWSREMPEMGSRSSSRLSERQGEENQDSEEEDYDDGADVRSEMSGISRSSQLSKLSGQVFLGVRQGKNRKLTRSRRIKTNQNGTTTGGATTTIQAQATPQTVNNTQNNKGKKNRRKKNKKNKNKGVKITEVKIPVGGDDAEGWAHINKENADKWIQRAAKYLHTSEKETEKMLDSSDNTGLTQYNGRDMNSSISRIKSSLSHKEMCTEYNKTIDNFLIIQQIYYRTLLKKDEAQMKKLQDQTGLSSENFAVYLRSRLYSNYSTLILKLFKTAFRNGFGSSAEMKKFLKEKNVKSIEEWLQTVDSNKGIEAIIECEDMVKPYVNMVNKCIRIKLNPQSNSKNSTEVIHKDSAIYKKLKGVTVD